MKQRIKNTSLTQSSKIWLRRQMNDEFVAQAKKLGYRSRASFKILEIQKKYQVFSKDDTVVDLGASPGGWSQIVSGIVKNVVAIDLLPMDPIENVTFICGDFLNSFDDLYKCLPNRTANVVISDMAPNTCGIRKIDHIRIMNLAESVYEFCDYVLCDGGHMITKVFQGGADVDFLNVVKRRFGKVAHFKPKSSRKESPEMYLVCIGFKKSGIGKSIA